MAVKNPMDRQRETRLSDRAVAIGREGDIAAFGEFLIPPRSARAFTLRAGQTVRVEDTEGRQPGDLVAFQADNLAVQLSQARTRVENRKVTVTRGDTLWTSTFPPEVMLTIVEDTHGGHDLLYPPCCRYALDKRFGVARDGCLENLAAALAPWGVTPPDIPDPLNLFFQVSVDAAGRMTVREPASTPGSAISLKAHLDCLIAVSTCPVPFPGKTHSGYRITIRDVA
jgi:hypothetical protein